MKRYLVTGIDKFDVNERVFCYRVRVVNIVKVNESTEGYGGATTVTFYDDNGDGKFETFQQGGTPDDYAPRIPKWLVEQKYHAR